MNPLRLLTVSILIAGVSTAQAKTEKKPPIPPAKTQEKPQEKPKTTDDKAQDKKATDQGKGEAGEQKPVLVDTTKLLQRSLEIAERERDFLKRVHDTGGLLKRFKITRRNALDMTERFSPELAGPEVPVKKKARLLGDGEKTALAPDVLFTVESAPVTQKEYDATLTYIKSYPQADGVATIETLTIIALIERKAPQGLYSTKARVAREIMEEIAKRISAGGSFADLAKLYSEDKESAARGGKRDHLVRKDMDKGYAMTAFSLKVGLVSAVFASNDGYHVVQVLGTKSGESPDEDRILTAHIVRRYNDTSSLENVAKRIKDGTIDLAFRTDDLRKFAPAQFK